MTEEEIFQRARQIDDLAQQNAYIQEACGGNSLQLDRIRRLLRIDREDTDFLENPAVETLNSSSENTGDALGSTIGPYRLIELVGEGGFGLVYRAEQELPVRRSVAVKLMKLGMDSRQMVARFRAEQQALALMNHPHIAAIFDCDQTSSGRPWFAMEYVPGTSITSFADSLHMEVRQRVAMMLDVCSAMEHAHQKGVIHRDIKPSNILAHESNGEIQLKIIDFGIAKAIQGSLTDNASITHGNALMGTPLYMSPEQASGQSNDVDTRSDIFSLGAVLYELITGRTPLDREYLTKSSIAQVMIAVRESEPMRPSQWYRSASDEASTSASMRNASAVALSSVCRQDLDWIVMKCLEKDRNRRYQSVSELRGDLQRYLGGQVVLAGPPSLMRQIRKIASRHRHAFVAGAAVLLSLVVGLGLSISQAIRATRAESRAQQQRDIALFEQRRADEENRIAQAVTNFVLEDLLGQADIAKQSGEGGRDPNIQVRELVARASRTVSTRFADQPTIEIAVRRTLSSAWLALGEIPTALEHAREAVRLSEIHCSPDDRQRLLSLQVLALALSESGQANEAIEIARQVRDRFTASLGESHIDTQRSSSLLAKALDTGGALNESQELLTNIVAQREQVLGPSHEDTLTASFNLAIVGAKLGKFAEAEQSLKNIVQRRMDAGQNDHPMTIQALLALAGILQMQERYEEAEPIYGQVEELANRLLGEDHPTTLSIVNDMANLYSSTGRTEMAGALYERVLKLRRQKQGEDNPHTWDAMNNLAIFFAEEGKHDQALPLMEEVVERRTAADGLDHPDTILGLNNLAMVYQAMDEIEKAISCYRSAIHGAQETLPSDHPQVITLQTNLGNALLKTDQPESAEEAFREALVACQQRYGEISREAASQLGRLAISLHEQGRNSEAEEVAQQQIAIRREVHPDLWTTAVSVSLLGKIQASLGKLEEAEGNLLSGAKTIADGWDEIPPPNRIHAQQALDWIVEYFEQHSNASRADEWRAIRDAKRP